MTFGVYVHVPFCSSRCGYCDFNTYTPSELGGSSPDSYLDALEKELDAAAQTYPLGPADTVFIGGGTPSLIGAAGLERVLRAVRNSFGVAAHAEITTEANPESTSQEFFDHIRAVGYNRVSLGMQSASPTVLRILERRHTPGRAFQAIAEAHATGFEHLNLDVIYGTPGESDDDLRATLDAVLDAPVDHVSAYSLIVEDGTAMARKVRKGIIPQPDEDTYADRYAMIDQASTGTKCPPGPNPAGNACTTWATGATTTTTGQAPAHTRTSETPASTTSNTPPLTPHKLPNRKPAARN